MKTMGPKTSPDDNEDQEYDVADEYIQAIRETIPPPGYEIWSGSFANRRGSPVEWSWGSDTHVADRRVVGGYETRRKACLAAWEHYDKQSQCEVTGPKGERCEKPKGHGAHHCSSATGGAWP